MWHSCYFSSSDELNFHFIFSFDLGSVNCFFRCGFRIPSTWKLSLDWARPMLRMNNGIDAATCPPQIFSSVNRKSCHEWMLQNSPQSFGGDLGSYIFQNISNNDKLIIINNNNNVNNIVNTNMYIYTLFLLASPGDASGLQACERFLA